MGRHVSQRRRRHRGDGRIVAAVAARGSAGHTRGTANASLKPILRWRIDDPILPAGVGGESGKTWRTAVLATAELGH